MHKEAPCAPLAQKACVWGVSGIWGNTSKISQLMVDAKLNSNLLGGIPTPIYKWIIWMVYSGKYHQKLNTNQPWCFFWCLWYDTINGD
jgi:hypothetical protein